MARLKFIIDGVTMFEADSLSGLAEQGLTLTKIEQGNLNRMIEAVSEGAFLIMTKGRGSRGRTFEIRPENPNDNIR